jgi:hypothetical protein
VNRNTESASNKSYYFITGKRITAACELDLAACGSVNNYSASRFALVDGIYLYLRNFVLGSYRRFFIGVKLINFLFNFRQKPLKSNSAEAKCIVKIIGCIDSYALGNALDDPI